MACHVTKKILLRLWVLVFLCPVWLWLSACRTVAADESRMIPSSPVAAATDPEEEHNAYMKSWGIRVESIRYSAGGYMLDFRFRILEPDKASRLLDRKIKPYLLDEKSNRRCFVPAPAKTGALRQTSRSGQPLAGRVYFIIFANPGKLIRQGDAVTVVIGDFKAKGLLVQ